MVHSLVVWWVVHIFGEAYTCSHIMTVSRALKLDMAKRSGRVGFGSGQSGRGSKRVTGQNGSFLNGSIGLLVKRVTGWVGSSWPVFFKKKKFFFFEVDVICQLFMSSLTIIRFSLVILLPITTKHFTWYPNLVQLLFQLSRS